MLGLRSEDKKIKCYFKILIGKNFEMFLSKIDLTKNVYDKAIHLYGKKNYIEAIEQLDKVLLQLENVQTDKQINSECFYLKGICLVSLNRDEEALESFDCSIKLNQKYFQAEFAKGCLLKQQKRYVESFER